MSDCPSKVAATLLFADKKAPAMVNLMNEFPRLLRAAGMAFSEAEALEDGSVRLSNPRLRLVVSESMAPQDACLPAARGAPPPEECPAITVTVESPADPDGPALPRQALISAGFHAARLLGRALGAEAIHWHPTETRFTPEGFRASPLRAPQMLDPREETAQGPAGFIVDAAVSGFDHAVTRMCLPETAPVPVPAAIPVPVGPVAAPPPRFATAPHGSPVVTGPRLAETADAGDLRPRLPEQLAVYVMSLAMMVLVFPVGFAVMIYNILAGENLRLTAIAMALTGIGFAVSLSGLFEYAIAMN